MARIIFIEDDPDVVLSYRLMLENHGHKVVSCLTGEDGLMAMADGEADLIICDMALPGIDGATVCRHLKENERTRNIPIILFTCVRIKYGIDISEKDKAWIPADKIIDKADTPDSLLKAIKELLSHRDG